MTTKNEEVKNDDASRRNTKSAQESGSIAMHGSLNNGFDVDCTHISNCCEADLRIEGETMQYYVCMDCGYPCDIRESNVTHEFPCS